MLTPGRIIVGKNNRIIDRTQDNVNNYTNATQGKVVEAQDIEELQLIKPSEFVFGYVKDTKRLYYFNNIWIPINKVVQSDPTDIIKTDYIVTSASRFYNIDNISGSTNYIQNKVPYSFGICADVTVNFLNDSEMFQIILMNDTESRIIRILNYADSTVVESQDIQIVTLFDGVLNGVIRIRFVIDSSNLYVIGYDNNNTQIFSETLSNNITVNTIRMYPKINGNVNTNYIRVNSVFSGMSSNDMTSYLLGNNSGFSVMPRRWL